MAWAERAAIHGLIGAPNIESHETTEHVPIGTIVAATGRPLSGTGSRRSTGEFIYLRGVASTQEGELVRYTAANGVTVRNTETAGAAWPLAVAMAATVANEFGWYQISGYALVRKTAVPIAGGSKLYQSETVGSVEAVASATFEVHGCRVAATTSTSTSATYVLAYINRPHMEGQ